MIAALGALVAVLWARHALERDVAVKEYMPSQFATRDGQSHVSVRSMSQQETFELGRRIAAAPRSERVRISSPDVVAALFQPMLRDRTQEVFMVLLLDSANNLLRDVTVTTGLLNSSLVHPREVFRPAILEPAASIILLHNHPSGNPEPSAEDVAVTRQLSEAGKLFGIPVHDHVIVTPGGYTSFAERGLL